MKSRLKIFAIRLSESFFDDLLTPFRFVCFPFWFVRRFFCILFAFFSLLANEYLKTRLGHCGRGVRLYGNCRITAPHRLQLGDNVHINVGAFIRAEGGVSIGDNTHIARNIMIYSMNHQFEGTRLPYDDTSIYKPVRIGRNVWIGANVAIAPGSQIGDGAIIAMGAVVSGQIEPHSIVAAAPLRILRKRDIEHYSRLDSAKEYAGMAGHFLRKK